LALIYGRLRMVIMKIQRFATDIYSACLPVILYGCETWSFIPRRRTNTEDVKI
jgi:hypothetical protein